MRDYADQGYDLIICVGNELSDAALAVAGSFPDVTFAVNERKLCAGTECEALSF